MWEPAGPREGAGEAPVDVPRYIGAVRRAGGLIALIVIPFTAGVLLLSLLLPESYRAETTLVLDERLGLMEGSDAALRRLSTVQTLLTSRDVLAAAARELPGETERTLEDKVDVTVDEGADIVRVQGSDDDAEEAAAIAHTVALTYLDQDQTAQRRPIATARADLEAALERLRNSGGSDAEISAVRSRLSELTVREAAVGHDLRIAEVARPPSQPHAPKPLQNTLFAFFASVLLAVIAALARDVLSPRVIDPGEFARLSRLRPIAILPKRWSGGRLEPGLRTLLGVLNLELPPGGQAIVITSAGAGGTAALTTALGRRLADSGARVLIVDGNLEHPALHRHAGVNERPGLADLLEHVRHGEAVYLLDALQRAGGCDVITAARRAPELLTAQTLGPVIKAMRAAGYDYVLVAAPPLLGGVEVRLLSTLADAVIVLCRLDRLTPVRAAEVGDAAEALSARALGAVVVAESAYIPPPVTPPTAVRSA